MAKHRHHHHHRRRHNPFGVNGSLVKDVAFNAAGLAGANFGASFLAQSGWMNVAATAGAAIAISFLGKSCRRGSCLRRTAQGRNPGHADCGHQASGRLNSRAELVCAELFLGAHGLECLRDCDGSDHHAPGSER